jgi:NAD(P)-dependent dehydrogenase (short-subunit alcohol dehydrogenase family)
MPLDPTTPEQQETPGPIAAMDPGPEQGEATGRLTGRVALITGGDRGIGRAVATAFAREGADVVISYFEDDADAQETAASVEEAGRQALLLPGDIGDADHCRALVNRSVQAFGRLDILVNTATHQAPTDRIEDIDDEEWHRTVRTNLDAVFFLSKAAAQVMQPGGAIITTTPDQSSLAAPGDLAFATTAGAITAITASLAVMLGPYGIRVNAVTTGPIPTPLAPVAMPGEELPDTGTVAGRPVQPAGLAGAYVRAASDEGMTGAVVPATDTRPLP